VGYRTYPASEADAKEVVKSLARQLSYIRQRQATWGLAHSRRQDHDLVNAVVKEPHAHEESNIGTGAVKSLGVRSAEEGAMSVFAPGTGGSFFIPGAGSAYADRSRARDAIRKQLEAAQRINMREMMGPSPSVAAATAGALRIFAANSATRGLSEQAQAANR
jgi:hypothetical protein